MKFLSSISALGHVAFLQASAASIHTDGGDLQRPAFEDLPLGADHPPWSAWGLWGEDDELGTLNLLTPEVTRKAAGEVREGIVVPLK